MRLKKSLLKCLLIKLRMQDRGFVYQQTLVDNIEELLEKCICLQ